MSELATNREHERSEYLIRLNSLAEKIRAAITALEHNDLRQLELSLAAQESICGELSQAKWLAWLSAKNTAVVTQDDPALTLEIRRAQLKLAQLNRVYSALLKRSQRTVGLFTGLYRGYGMGYDKNRPAVAEPHTWSCEA